MVLYRFREYQLNGRWINDGFDLMKSSKFRVQLPGCAFKVMYRVDNQILVRWSSVCHPLILVGCSKESNLGLLSDSAAERENNDL